jgi:serine/threonine protein kinase
MPLSDNSKLLVEKLESTPLLDGRFEQIKLVNFDSVSDNKRGCFSLVFRAYDRANEKVVALKFYDISPDWMFDNYRRKAFDREHEILQTLLSKERCLQLKSALSTFNLIVNIPSQPSITLPCRYFAVDWIENDIDDYFFLGKGHNTIEKLKLFNEIVLSIEALHRHEVFHRDIKYDNLRAYQKALTRIVVAIDLGTAARVASGYIQSTYAHPVGAPGYAGPEARCGLAGNRIIAPYTDKYALGCLLFELFNKNYCFHTIRQRNPHLDTYLHAMALQVNGERSEIEQLKKWKIAINQYGAGIYPIEINTAGSHIPNVIACLLNDIMNKLINVDFSRRPKLEWVRNRIWIAIRVLENEKIYQHKLKNTKENRLRRKEKLAQKEIRLRKHLDLKGSPYVNK